MVPARSPKAAAGAYASRWTLITSIRYSPRHLVIPQTSVQREPVAAEESGTAATLRAAEPASGPGVSPESSWLVRERSTLEMGGNGLEEWSTAPFGKGMRQFATL